MHISSNNWMCDMDIFILFFDIWIWKLRQHFQLYMMDENPENRKTQCSSENVKIIQIVNLRTSPMRHTMEALN